MTSEAARADLYTGLIELLGPERAETLMSLMSNADPDKLATKADVAELKTDVSVLKTDVAALKTDVAELKTDVSVLKTDVSVLKTDVAGLKSEVSRLDSEVRELRGEVRELRVEMSAGFAAMNERFDRMYLTLTAGLFVIVAAMIGVFFNTL